MCSVSAALIGLTAAQGITSMASAHQQAKAQSAYYNSQAEAAEQNARIADKQREQISDKYLQKQQQLDARRRLVIGQHAAEAGASGLTSSGSVQDMDAATIDEWRNSSMNLLGNQRNDTKSAYINQVNYINQANNARAAAYNARQQGKQAMFGTLLSTAASIYGVAKTYGGTKTSAPSASGGLHHQAAMSGTPETMEDQVYAMNKYKPQKLSLTKSPYSWLGGGFKIGR